MKLKNSHLSFQHSQFICARETTGLSSVAGIDVNSELFWGADVLASGCLKEGSSQLRNV